MINIKYNVGTINKVMKQNEIEKRINGDYQRSLEVTLELKHE